MCDNPIIKKLDNPSELEHLYRENPSNFQSWLAVANDMHGDSMLLAAWNARLGYTKPTSSLKSNRNSIVTTFLYSLFALLLIKLPVIISVEGSWFYPRFAPIIVIGSLVAYFATRSKLGSRQYLLLATSMIVGSVVMLMMPDIEKSHSIVMSQIHMPLALLSILGVSFMAFEWRDLDARLHYIRYLGEVIIYLTIVLLGGAILMAITYGLFSLIDISLKGWYEEYFLVWGLVASPIVATFLFDTVLERDSKIATIVANVFSPLFLLTVIAYLIAMFVQQESPYSDRAFLIIFNGLLLVVWGIAVFSIAGRTETSSRMSDTVNICLVFTTLIINTIALSAIVFRIGEYGISPNKLAVVGANICIFIHLILILMEYIKQMKSEFNTQKLTDVIAKYLPIYSAWSVFIVVCLPLIFGYE